MLFNPYKAKCIFFLTLNCFHSCSMKNLFGCTTVLFSHGLDFCQFMRWRMWTMTRYSQCVCKRGPIRRLCALFVKCFKWSNGWNRGPCSVLCHEVTYNYHPEFIFLWRSLKSSQNILSAVCKEKVVFWTQHF